MARTSTALAVKHALARARHHYPKPIVIRTTPAKVKHHRKGHKRGGGRFGGLLGPHKMGIAMGAAALGFIQKQNIAIPKLPLLGEAGTIGLIAWFLSDNGRNKFLDDVATASFAVAAYELGSTGTITGEAAPGFDPSAYVSGF